MEKKVKTLLSGPAALFNRESIELVMLIFKFHIHRVLLIIVIPKSEVASPCICKMI